MGIAVFVMFPLVIAGFGIVAGRLGDRSWNGPKLPPLWPRKGPCFGEPIREGGEHFGGRRGELFHRNPVGDREFMR